MGTKSAVWPWSRPSSKQARCSCLSARHGSLILKRSCSRFPGAGTTINVTPWDLDALKIEFEELILLDAPIEITGFSPAEIDHVILGYAAEGLEQGPLEPDPATAVARIGDIFRLGPHRIVCGDATDPAVLARLSEGD